MTDSITCTKCETITDDFITVFDPILHSLCMDCFNDLYPPFDVHFIQDNQITISDFVYPFNKQNSKTILA